MTGERLEEDRVTMEGAPTIDPRELNDLLDFAARGGLGQAVATQDCVAKSPDQLMYIAGDTLVLLRDMGSTALASCEGVVGWINKDSIDFDNHSAIDTADTGSPPIGVTAGGLVVPDTIISSPTPPTKTISLPAVDTVASESAYVIDDEPSLGLGLGVNVAGSGYGTGSGSDGSPASVGKRASGPFDLGTPQYSPEIHSAERGFFEEQQQQQQQQHRQHDGEEIQHNTDDPRQEVQDQELPDEGRHQTRVRASVLSTASSEAFGGIGGFMMGHVGDGSLDASGIEALRDTSPPAEPESTANSITRSESDETEILAEPSTSQPFQPDSSSSYASPTRRHQLENAPLQGSTSSPISPASSKGRPESSDSWDIYGDYARDSMYYKRSTRDIRAMSGMDQAFNLAKALSEIPSPPPSSTRTTFSQGSTSTATTTGSAMTTTKSISTAPGPPVDQDAMSPRSRSRPRPLPLDTHSGPVSLGLGDDPSQSQFQSQIRSPSTLWSDHQGAEVRSPIEGMNGQSIATELRLRIQREREREAATSSQDITRGRTGGPSSDAVPTAPAPAPILPPRSSSRLTAAIAKSDSPESRPPPTFLVTNVEDPDEDTELLQSQVKSSEQSREDGTRDVGNESGGTEMSADEIADSEQSTIIETPVGPPDDKSDVATTSPIEYDGVNTRDASIDKDGKNEGSPPLLASPIPLQVTQPTSSEFGPVPKLPTPQLSISPDPGTPYQRLANGTSAPMSPSPRLGLSPDMASLPGSPFSPGSPASPHSVTATRQAAAEITRSASASASGPGAPGRITTLLGRTEDLLGSRGPVPITFHMGSPGGFRSTGPASSMAKEATHGLGLGLPSSSSSSGKGRVSPSGSASGHGPMIGLNGVRRATSPLIGSAMIEQPSANDHDSRFPRAAIQSRNTSSPAQTYTTPPIPSSVPSPDPATTKTTTSTAPANIATQSKKKKSDISPGTTPATATTQTQTPGLFPRARSRSFGATVAKAMGRGKKDKEKPPPPPLAINTALSPKSANVVSLPAINHAGNGTDFVPPRPVPSGRKGSSSSVRSGSVNVNTNASGKTSSSPDPNSSSQQIARRPSSPGVPPSPLGSFVNGGSPQIPTAPLTKTLTTDSAVSQRSATSPGFPSPTLTSESHSGIATGQKTPRKASKALGTPSMPSSRMNVNGTPTSLASPVSHRDYAEETVKADGLDFELVQPRKSSAQHLSPGSASPSALGFGLGSNGLPTNHSYPSPSSPRRVQGDMGGVEESDRPGMKRSETFKSEMSGASARSIPLAETDEWGFIKDQSPTPEIFQSRSTASDHRSAETKWLSTISTPLPVGAGVPKKVRKLALESGIPASLRGKVWAWMLASNGTSRTPGLYFELISHSSDSVLDQRTEEAINTVYKDHSAFAGPSSTGTSDLRQVLIAHSRHSSIQPTPTLALIAGMLLIHCVAEDAFWLLDGLVGSKGLLRGYIATSPSSGSGTNANDKGEGGNAGTEVEVDSAVFVGLLAGSEKQMSKKFKEMGLHPRSFLGKWYQQLFIRCLPWPTALRVIDALIAEGPRFLLITSLSILTLSRDRIMELPSKAAILSYLDDLPQDALLLPEHFIKACSEVKFREEDYRKLRNGVQKEMGL